MNFLPPADLEYLKNKRFIFEEKEENGNKGLILKRYPLPPGQFDVVEVDILILLPPGYPDISPDMFYLLPWIRLVSSNTYPKAADQPLKFAEETWQRWSRHNQEWRPGIDGIWTMLKRIEHAIEKAA